MTARRSAFLISNPATVAGREVPGQIYDYGSRGENVGCLSRRRRDPHPGNAARRQSSPRALTCMCGGSASRIALNAQHLRLTARAPVFRGVYARRHARRFSHVCAGHGAGWRECACTMSLRLMCTFVWRLGAAGRADRRKEASISHASTTFSAQVIGAT